MTTVTSFIFLLLKLLLCIVGVYILQIIYRFVYLPWRVRNKYKKFSNVTMNEKFNLMTGDVAEMAKNEKESIFRAQYYRDLSLNNQNYDFYISQQGASTIFDVLSTEALNEFEKLVPFKIDRHNHYGINPIGNIVPHSFLLLETTKECVERRKEAMKSIGINHISRYIPLMIEATDEWAKSVKKNEEIDLSLECSKIIFAVIAKILFGKDVDNMLPIPYISPKTGKTTYLSPCDFYFQYGKDEFDGYTNPKGCFFPFLAKYGLAEPYCS